MKSQYRVPKKDRTRESAGSSEVMRVLTRNGLGFMLSRMPFRRKRPTDWGKRLRKSFEELGPTYIKLGQMMSTRYDIFPPEVIEELSNLHEEVPPFSTESYKKVIARELGDIDGIFAEIEWEPFAAASIAQVHRGRLKDGTEVAIKVRRPGITATVENDIQTLKDLIFYLDLLPVFKNIDLGEIVQEFGKRLEMEMDFRSEARAMNKFNRNFADNPLVHAPGPHMELCTEEVLVMDFVPGITLSKLFNAEEDPFPLDRPVLINTIGEAFMDQIFFHGFIHDDPHPGNLIVNERQEVYFIDFGKYSYINGEMQRFLLEYVLGLVKRDPDLITDIISERFHMEKADTYAEDLKIVYSKFHGKKLGEINISSLMKESFRLNREHKVYLPTQFFFLGRIIMMLEGIAKKLDSDFDFIRFLQNYFDREKSLMMMGRRFRDLSRDSMLNLLLAPREIRGFRRFISGKKEIQFSLPKLERRVEGFIRAMNAIAIAIIMAALLMTAQNYYDSFLFNMGILVLTLYIIYQLMKSLRH